MRSGVHPASSGEGLLATEDGGCWPGDPTRGAWLPVKAEWNRRNCGGGMVIGALELPSLLAMEAARWRALVKR